MPESIETFVRRAYERAWNEGDLDALLDIASEDIVFVPSGAFPDHEPEYRGRDQVRRLIKTLRAPFEQLEIQVAHVLERGDQILVLFQFRAVGREGLALQARSGHVGQMRDGLVTHIRAYADWQSAAGAVGMTLDQI